MMNTFNVALGTMINKTIKRGGKKLKQQTLLNCNNFLIHFHEMKYSIRKLFFPFIFCFALAFLIIEKMKIKVMMQEKPLHAKSISSETPGELIANMLRSYS